MASHPPGECCTVGVKHEGEAKGELRDIDGVSTYFAESSDASTHNAILILTDIFGQKYINVQLIADQMAANGYHVVVPDLFHGKPMPIDRPPDFDRQAWLKNHSVERIDPVIRSTLRHMRETLGCKRIGGVGYCFGAKYIARFLKKGVLDAGYMAHPSYVSNEELKGIEGPLSIAAAETDAIFPPEKRHETEAMLHGMDVAWQINLYSKAQHGFAVRADLSVKATKWAKEQAFLQAIYWFDEYVKV